MSVCVCAGQCTPMTLYTDWLTDVCRGEVIASADEKEQIIFADVGT